MIRLIVTICGIISITVCWFILLKISLKSITIDIFKMNRNTLYYLRKIKIYDNDLIRSYSHFEFESILNTIIKVGIFSCALGVVIGVFIGILF